MIVCDSSPLIALAYIDKLQVLDRIFDGWWVAPAVLGECSVKDKVFSKLFNSILPQHLKHPHDSKLVDVLSLQIQVEVVEDVEIVERLRRYTLKPLNEFRKYSRSDAEAQGRRGR
jgi:predicted nucleic acid-binding protein